MTLSWKPSADTALREKLWAGSIPIKIDLALNDVSALDRPCPMYVLANRMAYLAIFLKDIRKHFDSFAPSPCDQSEVWLDFDKIPLSWNLPVGVMFDLLEGIEQAVPWTLTLHYRGIPADKITRCSGVESIRFFYINALKEAMYLRTNSSKEIMNMAKEEENRLIEGIIKSNTPLTLSELH
jgi:autophagy-related protein 5